MPLVEVRGRKLYFEKHEALAPDPVSPAPPLVLVMGMAGRCTGWLPMQVPSFRQRRAVVIYDHRGVGDSEDGGEPFTTQDLGADLVGLVDALELEQVDTAGLFMGGMAIQEAALAAPERFRRLVLIGSWARPDAKRRMLIEQWAALARHDTPASFMIRQRLVWTMTDETLEQREIIEPVIEFLAEGGAPLTGEHFARQCDACIGHDTLDRLSALEHPTLALCGRRDLLTPSKFSREIAEAMPHARDVALSYGGHAIMAERPDRLNQIVEHFLDEPEHS